MKFREKDKMGSIFSFLVRTSPSSTAQTNDNERSKYRSPNLYNPLGIFYYFRSEKQAVQAVSSLINEGLYEEGLLRFEKYYNSRHETTQHVRVRGELCPFWLY
jgi:hypothetical protein